MSVFVFRCKLYLLFGLCKVWTSKKPQAKQTRALGIALVHLSDLYFGIDLWSIFWYRSETSLWSKAIPKARICFACVKSHEWSCAPASAQYWNKRRRPLAGQNLNNGKGPHLCMYIITWQPSYFQIRWRKLYSLIRENFQWITYKYRGLTARTFTDMAAPNCRNWDNYSHTLTAATKRSTVITYWRDHRSWFLKFRFRSITNNCVPFKAHPLSIGW